MDKYQKRNKKSNNFIISYETGKVLTFITSIYTFIVVMFFLQENYFFLVIYFIISLTISLILYIFNFKFKFKFKMLWIKKNYYQQNNKIKKNYFHNFLSLITNYTAIITLVSPIIASNFVEVSQDRKIYYIFLLIFSFIYFLFSNGNVQKVDNRSSNTNNI